MHWVRSLTNWIFRGPKPARCRKQYRRALPGAGERLERREVLTATVAAPFASVPGSITSSPQRTHVDVTVALQQVTFTRPGAHYVGVAANPAAGSSVKVRISDVTAASEMLYSVNKNTGGPFIVRVNTPGTSLESFGADVYGQDDAVGQFVLNAFLPGDLDGNGTVNAADVARVQTAYGSHQGQSNYDPAADLNQDGRVGCLDLTIAKANLGAKAPVVAEWTAPVTPVVTPVAAPVTSPAVNTRPVVPTPVVAATVVATPIVTPQAVSTPVVAATVVAAPVVATPIATPQVVAQPAQTAQPMVVYYQPVGTVPANTQAVQGAYYLPGSATVQSQPIAQAQAGGYGQQYVLVPVSNEQVSTQAPVYLVGQPGLQNPGII